jgi:predicted XRE-type DNA-binding protein
VHKKYLALLDEGWENGSHTFAELGLENVEKLQAKAYLRAAILARTAALEISQSEAARRIGVPQPKLSNLMADAAPRGFSRDGRPIGSFQPGRSDARRSWIVAYGGR